MKKISISILTMLFLSTLNLKAQVEEVKYMMEYNCETAMYDVKLKIMKGSATSVIQRAQFNSQISIVLPTGMEMELLDYKLPLQNNQDYEGNNPMEWNLSSPVINPEGAEGYDFYSIIPSLTPASFYNDILEGEKVKLFSFTTGEVTAYNEEIRFFDNTLDAKKSYYEGSDLRNGFSMGSSKNIYGGNIHKNCSTAIEEGKLNNIKAFPNPATNKLNIQTPKDTKSIKVIDSSGNKVIERNNPVQGMTILDVVDWRPGIYFIHMVHQDSHKTQQVSVF